MALSQTINHSVQFVGTISLQAYCRVHHVYGNKTAVEFEVHWLQNDGAGALIKSTRHMFVPDLNGANFIKQSYLHLKTLPEFAGATDC